jgi:hypothetical protein
MQSFWVCLSLCQFIGKIERKYLFWMPRIANFYNPPSTPQGAQGVRTDPLWLNWTPPPPVHQKDTGASKKACPLCHWYIKKANYISIAIGPLRGLQTPDAGVCTRQFWFYDNPEPKICYWAPQGALNSHINTAVLTHVSPINNKICEWTRWNVPGQRKHIFTYICKYVNTCIAHQ